MAWFGSEQRMENETGLTQDSGLQTGKPNFQSYGCA
jgi:hypothetical protein